MRRQRDNRRSEQARLYRRLYQSPRWRKLRAYQLAEHPLCQCAHCREGDGRVTVATVVDHIKPHNGDEELFFDEGNIQSMAKTCHDKWKQSSDRGGAGFNAGCDKDGMPLSNNHWWRQ